MALSAKKMSLYDEKEKKTNRKIGGTSPTLLASCRPARTRSFALTLPHRLENHPADPTKPVVNEEDWESTLFSLFIDIGLARREVDKKYILG